MASWGAHRGKRNYRRKARRATSLVAAATLSFPAMRHVAAFESEVHLCESSLRLERLILTRSSKGAWRLDQNQERRDQTSFQDGKIAACPRQTPSGPISCQTTPCSIQKRRPDLAIRKPR